MQLHINVSLNKFLVCFEPICLTDKVVIHPRFTTDFSPDDHFRGKWWPGVERMMNQFYQERSEPVWSWMIQPRSTDRDITNICANFPYYNQWRGNCSTWEVYTDVKLSMCPTTKAVMHKRLSNTNASDDNQLRGKKSLEKESGVSIQWKQYTTMTTWKNPLDLIMTYSDFERFLYRLYQNIRNLVMLNFVVVVIKNNGKNKDCSM